MIGQRFISRFNTVAVVLSQGAQQTLVIGHHPFAPAAPGQYRSLLERFFRVGNDQIFIEDQFLSQPMTNRAGPKR